MTFSFVSDYYSKLTWLHWELLFSHHILWRQEVDAEWDILLFLMFLLLSFSLRTLHRVPRVFFTIHPLRSRRDWMRLSGCFTLWDSCKIEDTINPAASHLYTQGGIMIKVLQQIKEQPHTIQNCEAVGFIGFIGSFSVINQKFWFAQ